MINSTDRASKSGQMALATKETTQTEKKRATGSLPLLTVVTTRVSSTKTKFRVEVTTFGPTERPTKASGFETKWTDRASLPGRTESDMRANLRTTNAMAMGVSCGPTAANILGSGRLGSSMALVLTFLKKGCKNGANGTMVGK